MVYFPKRLKVARVKQLFKKGKVYLSFNYRSISLLTSLSKIYENVVNEQLLHYMEGNSLFYETQYRFRPGHSTELSSSRFVNELVQNTDNFETATSILIDLSKTFDTLNHDIILYKKEHLTGTVNCHGSTTKIDLWTAFISDIYINDFPLASNILNALMYAVVTTLICNYDKILNDMVINSEINKIFIFPTNYHL